MAKRYKVTDSPHLVPFDGSFRVADHDTRPSKEHRSQDENDAELAMFIGRMQKLQSKLMANDERALLLIFQALDAAGKDGTVKAVMSGINPAGCEVYSFKKPSDLDLDHDFLWRTYKCMPERGRIGIFNRSYYEEVLVARVHPELLDRQRLPDRPKKRQIWAERYDSIRDVERHLARNGTHILKFWLHVSKKEQKRLLLSRIDDPAANWKFSGGDIRERQLWGRYMEAYEDALNETSRPWAPWYALPADDKHYMRRAVAQIVVETLESMHLEYPVVPDDARRDMLKAKRELLAGR
jgi:PPK2 family polyphosphate:nucleotide phosphotransferase